MGILRKDKMKELRKILEEDTIDSVELNIIKEINKLNDLFPIDKKK